MPELLCNRQMATTIEGVSVATNMCTLKHLLDQPSSVSAMSVVVPIIWQTDVR